MQFKVGHRVRYLNEVGEGIVVAISNSKIKVEDEHGFDTEYSSSELVLASKDEDYKVDSLDAQNQKE